MIRQENEEVYSVHSNWILIIWCLWFEKDKLVVEGRKVVICENEKFVTKVGLIPGQRSPRPKWDWWELKWKICVIKPFRSHPTLVTAIMNIRELLYEIPSTWSSPYSQVCVDAPPREDHLPRDRRDDRHCWQEWGLEDQLFRVSGDSLIMMMMVVMMMILGWL